MKKHIFKLELTENGKNIRNKCEIDGSMTLLMGALAELIKDSHDAKLLIIGALGQAIGLGDDSPFEKIMPKRKRG